MTYSSKPTGLTGYVAKLGVVALTALGCEKQEPSKLEVLASPAQTVAHAESTKLEIDLSSPSATWETYEKMCKEGRWDDTRLVWDGESAERRETDEWMKSMIAELNGKYGNDWDLQVVKLLPKEQGRFRCKVAVHVRGKQIGDSEGFNMNKKDTSYKLIGM